MISIFIIGLFIGVVISGIFFFIFFGKKIIKYKKEYDDSTSYDDDLTLRFRKIEKELKGTEMSFMINMLMTDMKHIKFKKSKQYENKEKYEN